HLPADPGAFGPSRLLFAAGASPWPGNVVVDRDDTGANVATLLSSASLGELLSGFDAGPTALWDDTSVLDVLLYNGHLASADETSVLAGANRLAIVTDTGAWEIVGF